MPSPFWLEEVIISHNHLLLDQLHNIGVWKHLDSIQDDQLRSKACEVPGLLDAAYTEGTLAKYRSAWKKKKKKWIEWCSLYREIKPAPADPFFICVYFSDLINSKSSINVITTALCGIRWGHIKAGFYPPTNSHIVKLAYKGAKRLAESAEKNRKEPFTIEIINKLISHYGNTENLIHLRFILIFVLGFAGFFRISELLDLQVKDIFLKESWVEIFVNMSKTNQYREGNLVYIAKTGSRSCPMKWLKKYLSTTGLISQPESYLLCRFAKTKRVHNVLGVHPITYQTARKSFLEHISFLDSNINLGLHSHRSGGATAASNNKVDERLIGKHGRWNSTSARELYIKTASHNVLVFLRD